MKLETTFSMDTSSIKYGPGVTREVGWDMEEQGCKRVMVVTDANLSDQEPVGVTLEALRKHGIDAVLFDQASVEPTDISFKEAIQFAKDGRITSYNVCYTKLLRTSLAPMTPTMAAIMVQASTVAAATPPLSHDIH